MNAPDTIICLIGFGSMLFFYVLTNLMRLHLAGGDDTKLQTSLTQIIEQHAVHYSWALKFIVNCFGYASIFVPGILIYYYSRKVKYFERCGDKNGIIPTAIRLCFYDRNSDLPLHTELVPTRASSSASNASGKRSSTLECLMISYCFVGLMVSYLTWGLLQEKIMTQSYETIDADGNQIIAHFRDSQFLVFANRFLAFVIATTFLYVQNRMQMTSSQSIRTVAVGARSAPLFKYSFASFSNIMSAWFQYEALKFVNFPTQVLAKSCKIIPVMLMGRIVSRAKYEFYEYLTAAMISFGMLFFLLGSESGSRTEAASSIASMTGILLLILYMTFDSFTSNWQSDLFKKYGMSSIQMMCGVNLFSTLFTATSLALQGGFMESIGFASMHPKFLFDCIILSISSAIGQLFIFYTISKFGAVVFTIIMTMRQAFAILLSCMVYNHHISSLGIIGILTVFFAIFLRVYCTQRIKSMRRSLDIRQQPK